ncbi:efflux RND transporter periplasmic adaptor subunit [Cyanobium sp. Morenito 9A2]|uniref:efflux RND transporter periplasmic adaptor subunit n=1 Tax=Cyanobium sp. Morenito 9A2 TaxID=2823718 RepID=UPI0020CF15C8|nr:efflux RND transporter periplasmic adaptor subunit [Cyanobium sp. Morenito 9A2]MCP9848308.1 efflux RND transporter periplasmic adaptor subunit [Cyanobium sp. Morenito 9A2]
MLQRAPTVGQETKPPGRLKRPRRQRKRLWAAGAVALALTIGGLSLWQSRRNALQTNNLDAYTVSAERGSLPGIVTASGELKAVRSVNVSPKRGGVLQTLYVDEGDRVSAGQPIALMDSGDLRDRENEFQAQVRQAEAEFQRSRSEFERRRKLFTQGAISQDDFITFSTRLATSKAALDATRQRSGQRAVERSELTIRAPFAGVITQRFADPGAFVTPTTAASANAGASSSSVVELAQGLEVVAKVPENDIGRIRVGQQASLRVEAFPDRRFAARVKQIAPRAVKSNNVTSFEVKLQLLDSPPELRIGMTADIDFQTGQLAERTLVPTVAVVTEGGKPGVLLVGKGNEPTFQPVELGTSSGRNTQILKGLKPGTKVFIDLPPWAKKRKEAN